MLRIELETTVEGANMARLMDNLDIYCMNRSLRYSFEMKDAVAVKLNLYNMDGEVETANILTTR